MERNGAHGGRGCEGRRGGREGDYKIVRKIGGGRGDDIREGWREVRGEVARLKNERGWKNMNEERGRVDREREWCWIRRGKTRGEGNEG